MKMEKMNALTLIITLVVGVILTGHDGRRAIVHHMCVHPDYRRQGIDPEPIVGKIVEPEHDCDSCSSCSGH